ITTEELGRLAADYRAMLDGASAAVLCGGLPDALPSGTYATFATYAAEAGVPVILDADGSADGSAVWPAAARHPALVIAGPVAGPAGGPLQAWTQASLARLLAAGPGAVATMCGNVVEVRTAAGQWSATLAGPPLVSRDALVAGLVPGIALGWSWPDGLQHAVSLAAAVSPAGELDLVAYERFLPKVTVTSH
ncbi:MAG: hypothetical protein ACRDNZ_17325, partial [Streptosporangiaceae bacterium]